MEIQGTSCRVFVSYVHESDELKQQMLEYANWLNDPGGLNCWIDRYAEDAPMPLGWPDWMRKQMAEAEIVLVICTPNYYTRYEKEEAVPKGGLGARFETSLMLNEYYQNGTMNVKFIPIITCKEDVKYIPDILQGQTYYDISEPNRKLALYRRLTGQPENIKPAVSGSVLSMAAPILKAELEPVKTKEEDRSSEMNQILDMKPGTKILQAFFALPVTKRFAIAKELDLIEEGEASDNLNVDKLSGVFLERAYKKKLLGDLWSKLFNESLDPNPFKK